LRFTSSAALFALPAFAFGMTAGANAAIPERTEIAAPTRLSADLHDLGRANPATPMTVTLMLGYRHPDELEALVEAQADPSSPAYRHFLTRSQFDAYFSPTAADYARAEAALGAGGFRITAATPNRLMIHAAATVGTVERFFSTRMERVRQSDGSVRLVNAAAATAPAGLRGLAVGVAGLDGVTRMHTDLERGPHGGMNPNLNYPGVLFGPDGGYGPVAYSKAYGMPVDQTTGKGESVGVVIDADYLDSDLKTFLKYFGIARTGPRTTRVLVDGGPPPGITPDSGETSLDVETIVGIAPAVTLYVYEFPSFSDDQFILDAYERVVTDDQVGPVNSSFGGCEQPDSSLSQMADAIALQGSALGITFHASSGDGGAYACSSVGVSAPASNPHFVAVGGTSLYLNPTSEKLEHEFAWSGSGGGVSTIFPEPKYQSKITTAIKSGRNVPDVAFDADPSTGSSWYVGGAFVGPVGGTSLASPIFGAGLALANSLNGSHTGFVNPAIYKLFLTEGNSSGGKVLFRDITDGSNGFYSAGPGYDDVTGLGALNFTNTSSTLK
jgi:kumamolisin